MGAERVFTYISSFLFPSKSRGDNCRHSWNHCLLFHCVLVPAAPLPFLTWEVQRRGVRSSRHGAPGDRHRRLLFGGDGFSFVTLPRGGNLTAFRGARGSRPLTRRAGGGGGGARRTKREERGRRGGGPGATGPEPGLARAEARGRNLRPPIGGALALLDVRWDWPDR